MKNQATSTRLAGLLSLMISLFAISACDKDSGGETEEESSVERPGQPGDGAPTVTQFLEMINEGDDLQASIRVFNFSDQPIQQLSSNLRYLDSQGNELGDFPWSISGPRTVSAGGHGDHEVGFMIPDGTVRVDMVIEGVTFGDGSTWSAGPSGPAVPEGSQ